MNEEGPSSDGGGDGWGSYGKHGRHRSLIFGAEVVCLDAAIGKNLFLRISKCQTFLDETESLK